MSEIDYRELLVKYMALIMSEESISFADRLRPDAFVTQEECDALVALEPEADALRDEW